MKTGGQSDDDHGVGERVGGRVRNGVGGVLRKISLWTGTMKRQILGKHRTRGYFLQVWMGRGERVGVGWGVGIERGEGEVRPGRTC